MIGIRTADFVTMQAVIMVAVVHDNALNIVAAVVDDNTLAVALPFEHNKHTASNSMHSLQLDISVHVLP